MINQTYEKRPCWNNLMKIKFIKWELTGRYITYVTVRSSGVFGGCGYYWHLAKAPRNAKPKPNSQPHRCYSGCRWMLLIYSGCCHPTRTHPCVVSVPAFKVPHPWLRPCLAFRHDLTAHQADQFRGTHTSWEQCSLPLVQLWKEMEYYVYRHPKYSLKLASWIFTVRILLENM